MNEVESLVILSVKWLIKAEAIEEGDDLSMFGRVGGLERERSVLRVVQSF